MKKITLLLALIAILVISGCLPQPVPTQVDVSEATINAIVAQTISAQLTMQVPPTATITVTAQPTVALPSPTVTSTATAIPPTPTVGPPQISAELNTNCRTGPGTIYPVVGYLVVGEEPATVVGRYAPGTWWVIQNPTRAGQCWVWAETTVVTGDTSTLPLVAAPPTPTPTNTPTITLTPTITNTSPPSATPTVTP